MEGCPRYWPHVRVFWLATAVAKGLQATTILLVIHDNIIIGHLSRVGQALAFLVGFLFCNPTFLNEVLILRDGYLHLIKGGLYGSKPLLHLLSSPFVQSNLEALGHHVQLITEFSPPAETFSQRR